MSKNTHMTISEFARYSGIKRENLIFYDKIGLLSPDFRGENKYRYYSQRQLSTAFLISSLRELGIGIEAIKAYSNTRTPLKMIELFQSQEEKIDAEINRLERLKGIMNLYTQITASALEEDISLIQMKKRPSIPVFWGPVLDDPKPFSDDVLNDFYDYASSQDVPLSYPLGAVVSKEALLKRTFDSPYQFYFMVPSSSHQFKPRGNYVVGYLRGTYRQTPELYLRMLDFIDKNQFRICGNAYEEYLLNEISVHKEEEYLIQVEIMVE